ncbi:unnamed protein product [Linum trigynum]|uniref:Uncharacterized protein n=1 Tax=Linum trigynum TaxID=586398 RepID=A0AAV2DDL2_9ROSI
MSNPVDKQQPQRQLKEVVTVKDVTTNKYDALAASLESLTEVTVRAAEASRGSIGAIEAMGDQIKASIEEMGKSVAANICGALVATMQEVLTQVLKNREPLVTPATGAAQAAATAAGVEPTAAAAAGSGAPSGDAGVGQTGARARREEKEAEAKPPGSGAEAGTAQVLAASDGAPGNSGARSATAPVFSGPGLLPTPTDLAQDKAQGKQKMAGYEGEPLSFGPDREEPWPEEEELSFGEPKGWMGPSSEEARWG